MGEAMDYICRERCACAQGEGLCIAQLSI